MILKGDGSLYSVVVIDDNRIAVEAIVRSTDWDLCGCQVAGSAYDGVAGLRLIEEVQPDIVVIDIQMPGFNGLEVIGKCGSRKRISSLLLFPATVSLNMPDRRCDME